MPAGDEWIRAPQRVVGYHGCALTAAKQIVGGATPILSNNPYDWLGRGLYFWEYGPDRAAQWARRRFPDEPAMLEAQIELGFCLNLLDSEHFAAIAAVHETVKEDRALERVPLPANSDTGRHELDRMVVELYCSLAAQVGDPFQTVRGAFPEGRPLVPGSKILSRTHVQVAVRDLSCVYQVRLVNLG